MNNVLSFLKNLWDMYILKKLYYVTWDLEADPHGIAYCYWYTVKGKVHITKVGVVKQEKKHE
jgi:hypothetical protein